MESTANYCSYGSDKFLINGGIMIFYNKVYRCYVHDVMVCFVFSNERHYVIKRKEVVKRLRSEIWRQENNCV